MPNNVRNDVRITGPAAVIAQLMADMRTTEKDGEVTPFDFEKILPMPASLKIESGSRSDEAVALLDYKENGGDTSRGAAYFERMLGFAWVKELGITTVAAMVAHVEAKDAERTARLAKVVKGQGADLELSLPLLELGRIIRENIAKYGAPDWYSWSVAHWGTKWNAYSHQPAKVTRKGKRAAVVYGFDTAWSSPEPVFQAVADKYGVTISVRVSGEVDRKYSYTVEPQAVTA